MQVRIWPPESPEPRLRTSSYGTFLVRDPFFCSCTDGWCSFIHEGDSKFYLASHSQHVSAEWVGWKSSAIEAEWEAVLPAREATGSPRLFSMLLGPPLGPVGSLVCMSVVSSKAQLGFVLIHGKETQCLVDLA